jgi:hypothetical protein
MSGRTIPASVIEVAAELVGLFDRERELALDPDPQHTEPEVLQAA